MKKDIIISESRSTTPWTGNKDANPLQSFLDRIVEETYESKHKRIEDSPAEIELLNQYEPKHCGHCSSTNFIRYGATRAGITRYKCKTCGRTFNILTGTIFQDHKISITEWMDYCLGLFRQESFNSIAKSNRNSFSTTKYWLYKIFAILEDYQDDIVLDGDVYIDEMCYKVRKSDIIYKEGNKELRGQSRNQMVIAIGFDGKRVIANYQGKGKTSIARTKKSYMTHISKGSTLIHDEEKCHAALVKDLELKSIAYNGNELKKIKDEDNPLDPINKKCLRLRQFLDAHAGFMRDDIDGYLNLFCFMMNEGESPYEKVEKLLYRAIYFPKTLTYRDVFCK